MMGTMALASMLEASCCTCFAEDGPERFASWEVRFLTDHLNCWLKGLDRLQQGVVGYRGAVLVCRLGVTLLGDNSFGHEGPPCQVAAGSRSAGYPSSIVPMGMALSRAGAMVRPTTV